uniref:Pentatricopeptide repeat-containing protein At2g27800-like n=1 Tax=Rhizophora mucronata TaxID=61149 RepID=A0A2P2PJL5_RHIMU
MLSLERCGLRRVGSIPFSVKQLCSTNPFDHCYCIHSKGFSFSAFSLLNLPNQYSVIACQLSPNTKTLNYANVLSQTQMVLSSKIGYNAGLCGYFSHFLCCFYSNKPLSRSYRRRVSKRRKANSKPILDEAKLQQAISQLPPRFTNEELRNVLTLEEDPLVCWELFNWASQQPRFRHDASTYHVTIKKLGVAKMYEEMDNVVNQVLAVRHLGNEALYNTIIYFFTEARKLTRAVNIFNHMKNVRNPECRPSIKTYNILFTAMLSRGRNSYINHIYMETIRCLFKQMVNDGIEPDIFALNSMIKGYVLSLHVNDALRIFHQMGVVYSCSPNSFSYDYLIHGLCAQGRTSNARELCNEMKGKGFVPSGKSYNSLVNALALNGEVDEAVDYLWEMIKKYTSADFITYKTILDEICRKGKFGEAMRLLKVWEGRGLVDDLTYKKLLPVLEDDFGSLS